MADEDAEVSMARTIGIGLQDFQKMITNNCFYIDKTDFIREWWESKDDVTLITRPISLWQRELPESVSGAMDSYLKGNRC